MRNLAFAVGLVSALILSVRAEADSADVPAQWTGIYLGANLGYGWGDAAKGKTVLDQSSFCLPAHFHVECVSIIGVSPGENSFHSVNFRGVVGGGQVGFNLQQGPFVLGGVADMQGTSMAGSASGSTPAAPYTVTHLFGPPIGIETTTVNPGIDIRQRLSVALDRLATIRARAGYAIQDWLFYGTGGVAIGHVKSKIFLTRPALDFLGPLSMSGSRSSDLTGWAAGGGTEYALSERWSFGIEYLHFDLGGWKVAATKIFTQNFTLGSGLDLSVKQRFSGNLIRAAINYRF
jgi:outer membrane immunogenic protein